MPNKETFISNTVQVNKIAITNYKGQELDITMLVMEVNIYESLYVNTITGTIDVIDSNEYISVVPIIGEETLSFDFILPGFQNNVNFRLENLRVYKISDRVLQSDKIQGYKLWFTSKEAISDSEQKICKAWNQETSTFMVKDIFKKLNSSKTLEVDNTIGVHNFISTNFSPFQSINYLASHRSINSNKLSDFAFFENFDIANKTTKFNFKSIGGLCSATPIVSFTFHPAMTRTADGVNVVPYNVENISFKKGFDILESKASGMYNQTYIYYDMLRKKYVVQKNNYDEVYNETKATKLEGSKSNKIFATNTNTYSEYVDFVYVNAFPTKISTITEINNINNKGVEKKPNRKSNSYIASHNDTNSTVSNLHEETLYRRDVLLQEFENNKIYLNDVSGNFNYTVGTVVAFNKPNILIEKEAFTDQNSAKYDKLISGNYLIVKNRHKLTRTEGINWFYKCYMEISKNTFKSAV